MKNTFLILAGVAILAVGGYMLMQPKKAVETSPVTVTPAPEVEGTETSMPIPQTITMDAGSFYYSVKEIKAKVGDKIKVVMTSKDMMHDFRIDEFNVNSGITKSGETVEFEFVVDKAGSFEYYCSVGQHRANGQVGKLIVE